MQIMLN